MSSGRLGCRILATFLGKGDVRVASVSYLWYWYDDGRSVLNTVYVVLFRVVAG